MRPQVGIAQMPRIKLDITLDEPVILSPVVKTVEHKYSDCPHEGISILCYDYEEIFAEKIRALAQRLRPRDLYDVVHLFHDKQFRARRELVYSTLISKCTIREIEVPTIKTIQNHENRNFLASEWETQLKHQVSKLPSFETFLNELPALFDWLGDKK